MKVKLSEMERKEVEPQYFAIRLLHEYMAFASWPVIALLMNASNYVSGIWPDTRNVDLLRMHVHRTDIWTRAMGEIREW